MHALASTDPLMGLQEGSSDALMQTHACPVVLMRKAGPSVLIRLRMCYTEKAPKAWHRRGTQKTGNTYNQPNRPDRHTSQTKHQARLRMYAANTYAFRMSGFVRIMPYVRSL